MPTNSTLEHPLPNNLEAERSVLGAVLLDNNALNAAIETLKPEEGKNMLSEFRRLGARLTTAGQALAAVGS